MSGDKTCKPMQYTTLTSKDVSNYNIDLQVIILLIHENDLGIIQRLYCLALSIPSTPSNWMWTHHIFEIDSPFNSFPTSQSNISYKIWSKPFKLGRINGLNKIVLIGVGMYFSCQRTYFNPAQIKEPIKQKRLSKPLYFILFFKDFPPISIFIEIYLF